MYKKNGYHSFCIESIERQRTYSFLYIHHMLVINEHTRHVQTPTATEDHDKVANSLLHSTTYIRVLPVTQSASALETRLPTDSPPGCSLQSLRQPSSSPSSALPCTSGAEPQHLSSHMHLPPSVPPRTHSPERGGSLGGERGCEGVPRTQQAPHGMQATFVFQPPHWVERGGGGGGRGGGGDSKVT